MQELIAWCGFLGAWLLFAGPVYQAALELREQEIQREDIEAATAGISQPPPVKPWWWLLPPVRYVLERRRNNVFWHDVMQSLPSRQAEALVTYMNKATGWLLVGAGGLFIAITETGNLVLNDEEWPDWVFWLVLVVMMLVAVTFVSVRVRRSQQLIGDKALDPQPADQV